MSHPAEQSAVASEIHSCGTCGCSMVQPLERERIGSSYWQILLRCPECEWSGTGVFTDAEAAVYDLEFERGMAQMLTDLQALTAPNA